MNRIVLRNAVSLLAIQGASFALPLIALPYVLRVLGPEKFGVVAFCQAVMIYLILFSDYGFNYTATQHVARLKIKPRELSELFWEVLAAKLVLACIGIAMLWLISLFIPAISRNYLILASLSPMVLGSIIFPQWFFQGLEKMAFISICTILAKIISIPFIFILVKNSGDSAQYGLVTSSSSVLSGAIAIFIIWRKRLVGFRAPTFFGVKRVLVDGWHVFISSTAISLYTTTNTVIIGAICGPVAVGYYAAADKIRAATQSLMSPLGTALYPRIISVMEVDRKSAYQIISRLMRVQGAVTLSASLALCCLASLIVRKVMGQQYDEAVNVLRILAFVPFLARILPPHT